MKFLRYSIFILLSLFLISNQSLLGLGMAPVTFKNVGACFKPGFEMYAPMFGSMALSSGFIENLRFYNVTPGPIDQKTEKRIYILDKEPTDDPIMKIILLLFPSPAGQLTVQGNGVSYVGNHLDEEDIAVLFNFVYGVRKWLAADEEIIKKKKVMQKKKMPQSEFSIIFEDQKLNDYLKKMKINTDALIKKLRSKSSEKKLEKNLKDILINIVKAIKQESMIHQKPKQKENRGEEEEEEESIPNTAFYPNHMIEQIIGAFFCHKFSNQENLKNLLLSLHNDIVDKEKISGIDCLLNEDDVSPARENIQRGIATLDDIWLALHQEYFYRMLPYKNNQAPISNGRATMYSRSSDKEKEEEGEENKKEKKINKEFSDCVETTIRHIMNIIFFDRDKHIFSLDKLNQFMQGKNQEYIQNLKEFYAYQTPDLADSGNPQVRSLWNRVVADLGWSIMYSDKFNAEHPNNNIRSGMLNFVRIFERIFNLEPHEELKYIEFQEDSFIQQAKERFNNCFKVIFEELSPKEIEFSINFSNIQIFSMNDLHDLSGDISININKKDSDQNLFSFLIEIIDGHIAIQNIKTNQKDSEPLNAFEIEQIVRKLNKLSANEGEASFFLADEFINNEKISIHPTYKVFGKTLNDTAGKLYSLNQCDNFFDHFNEKKINLIIKNIMQSYLWNDTNSVKILSKQFSDEKKWNNLKFRETFKKHVKKIHFEGPKIEKINISEFPSLNTLDINNCNNIQLLNGESTSIENLHILNSNINILNLSAFIRLKSLAILNCHNITFLEGSSKSIKKLTLYDLSLQKIDLSAFPKLKELLLTACKNIKYFDGEAENLKSLELDNLNIENLNLTSFPQLEELKIKNCNELESLDFSKCPLLKKLTLNSLEKFESLKESKSIESLDLNYLYIEKVDLSKYTMLKEVKIKHCHKLKLIIIPESFPDEQQKELEKQFPRKVRMAGEEIHLQDEFAEPCTIL